jgi:hypothetical protein
VVGPLGDESIDGDPGHEHSPEILAVPPGKPDARERTAGDEVAGDVRADVEATGQLRDPEEGGVDRDGRDSRRAGARAAGPLSKPKARGGEREIGRRPCHATHLNKGAGACD